MALQGYIDDFACDLAAAHLAALKLLQEGHLGGSFNLGTGSGFSVREILATIKRVTGMDVPHAVKPPGDPTYLVADPSASCEILGFVPNYSNLSTIIETAWRWHQKVHPGAPYLRTDTPLAAKASNVTVPTHSE